MEAWGPYKQRYNSSYPFIRLFIRVRTIVRTVVITYNSMYTQKGPTLQFCIFSGPFTLSVMDCHNRWAERSYIHLGCKNGMAHLPWRKKMYFLDPSLTWIRPGCRRKVFGFPMVMGLIPSKIEWDLTNGPQRKLLELLDAQVQGSVQCVLLEISWINGFFSTS